ncbi:MAG: ABC transporter substrate-binding protein [Aeromicrobium sp.]
MTWSRTKKIAAFVAATTMMLGTAACGSGDEKSADGLTEITVGILPTVDLAPFMYAIDEGLFEKRGLDVKTRVTSGGAEAIPALLAGDVDFIYTAYMPVLLGRQAGLDLTIASGSHTNTASKDSPSGIWVKPDSDIQTMADLKGKTVAVNSLGSVAELLVVASLDELGLERGDYDLVEIPFPDVPAALDQGRVDAAWVAEPGRATIIENLDARFVGSAEDPSVISTSDTFKDFPMAGYATRGNEDPKTLKAFHEAMAESLKILAADNDIARELAPDYTEIPEALLPTVAVSTFGQTSTAQMERLQDLMIEHGFLDGPIDDIDKLVYTP